MARKSILELVNQAMSSFPDNTTGLITPALLRQFCLDFLNAISPAYAYLTAAGPLTQVLGLTPAIVIFSNALDGDPAQTTSNAAAGTIARAERGTATLNFTADFVAPNNTSVTFTIAKNGTPTGWRISGVGRGAANPVSVALTAIDYADPAATYSVTAVAETNGTSVDFTDMGLILAVDPVRSYT